MRFPRRQPSSQGNWTSSKGREKYCLSIGGPKGMTERQERRRPPIPQEVWMDICNAHPRPDDGIARPNFLCDGSWPDALSATLVWRAWRVMNAGRTDALSQHFVEIADRALAFRAALAPEQHVWRPDSVACVPKHWRQACPEVDALARQHDIQVENRAR